MNAQSQLSMPFDAPVRRIETPAARSTDSAGSHNAAAIVTDSGKRHSNMVAVAKGVKANPGCTSAELAVLIRMDRVEVARRMSEAVTAGEIRKGDNTRCSISGIKVASWWPA